MMSVQIIQLILQLSCKITVNQHYTKSYYVSYEVFIKKYWNEMLLNKLISVHRKVGKRKIC